MRHDWMVIYYARGTVLCIEWKENEAAAKEAAKRAVEEQFTKTAWIGKNTVTFSLSAVEKKVDTND